MRYITWMKNFLQCPSCMIMWDCHSSHRRIDVKEHASKMNVGLIFVPAGQTDEWQPLDRAVFGSLKRRACSQFDELITDVALTDVDMSDGIKILVSSWEMIGEKEIARGWAPFTD